jgi:hypothetical protein
VNVRLGNYCGVDSPRLGETGLTQGEILERLWRRFAVDEIAMSIATNGFFGYEPLFVVIEDGRKIVVEGNRRLGPGNKLHG